MNKLARLPATGNLNFEEPKVLELKHNYSILMVNFWLCFPTVEDFSPTSPVDAVTYSAVRLLKVLEQRLRNIEEKLVPIRNVSLLAGTDTQRHRVQCFLTQLKRDRSAAKAVYGVIELYSAEDILNLPPEDIFAGITEIMGQRFTAPDLTHQQKWRF